MWGVLQVHKDPNGEPNGGKDGKDECVGKVVVHGKLEVVFPEAQGSTSVHNSSEDPIEDESVQKQEKGQCHY